MNSNFTGLILVTGESAPGIEAAILETLSPFTIQILDKQNMDIRERYFLAIHFSSATGLNPQAAYNERSWPGVGTRPRFTPNCDEASLAISASNRATPAAFS